jgi:hypothetical protein
MADAGSKSMSSQTRLFGSTGRIQLLVNQAAAESIDYLLSGIAW